MSVLSQISVGDVQYYYADSIPIHTAAKGSVCIVHEQGFDPAIYMNNNGGNVWVKLYIQTYGEIYYFGQGIDSYTLGTDTINSWYGGLTFNWQPGQGTTTIGAAGSSLDKTGFTINQVVTTSAGAYLNAGLMDTINPTTTLIKGNYSFSSNTRWNDVEGGLTFNYIAPQKYQGTTVQSNNAIESLTTFGLKNFVTGEWASQAYRYVAREAGGGSPSTKAYVPIGAKIDIIKVGEPRYGYVINENWSFGNFTGNGWTVVNDTTNQWYVGTAQTVNGTYGAYVSSDGGATATYNKTVNDVSHFYKNFTIPSSATTAYLIFDWKCWGENAAGATQYDYGAICIVDTGTTPVAGAEVITTEATGNGTTPVSIPSGNGRIGANRNASGTGQLGKFNEGYAGSNDFWSSTGIIMTNYIGQTKRLVITWKDDTTAGDDPPMCITNIKLIYY